MHSQAHTGGEAFIRNIKIPRYNLVKSIRDEFNLPYVRLEDRILYCVSVFKLFISKDCLNWLRAIKQKLSFSN